MIVKVLKECVMKDKNGYEIKVGDVLVCVYFDLDRGLCLDHCCVESVREITNMVGEVVEEYVEVNCGKLIKISNSNHLMFV